MDMLGDGSSRERSKSEHAFERHVNKERTRCTAKREKSSEEVRVICGGVEAQSCESEA